MAFQNHNNGSVAAATMPVFNKDLITRARSNPRDLTAQDTVKAYRQLEERAANSPEAQIERLQAQVAHLQDDLEFQREIQIRQGELLNELQNEWMAMIEAALGKLGHPDFPAKEK